MSSGIGKNKRKVLDVEALIRKWSKLEPLEKLILIYLQEGKSLEEIKGILVAHLALFSAHITSKILSEIEQDIKTGALYESIFKGLKEKGNEQRDMRLSQR